VVASHQLNHALEAEGKPRARSRQNRGEEFPSGEHGIEEILGQLGGAFPVGGGQRVLAGRGRPTYRRERSRVQAQGVTDIVESDGVGQLA